MQFYYQGEINAWYIKQALC